ncbi:MAG: uL15 family ribosomal protein [Candidatus Pacebacteria bacterium]|nr:uL15 family ribosomal protein [Candidatus Paceibacterota bacterium]
MQLHSLQRKTPNKKQKLVGRGGAKGKTSGRGTKGQRAHGGHGIRPEMRDTIKKIPKMRGRGLNLNTSRVVDTQVVNIKKLDEGFNDGDIITKEALHLAKMIKKVSGKFTTVKILSVGETTKKFTIEDCLVSDAAKVKIEKAGGTIK